jgi:hypothetical protein
LLTFGFLGLTLAPKCIDEIMPMGDQITICDEVADQNNSLS